MMPAFRSKPSECVAWQWSGPDSPLSMVGTDERGCFVITAHEQKCYLSPGDWIIKEPNHLGYYPCKPDVFEKRWEAI